MTNRNNFVGYSESYRFRDMNFRLSGRFRILLPFLLLWLLAGTGWAAQRTSNLWWIPDVASKGGEQIDQILYFICFLTGGVFVLIFIGLWGYSNHVWWDVIHATPPSDALEIGVTAYQFAFSMQYPGADGKLGRSDVKLISNDNLFGNDRSDPETKDNFTSAVLELPVNRPVHIRLNSKDVIHAFYIPEFRIYQDAVPGRTIDWVWFTPTKIGSYQLACSQLCGSGHYNMKAQVEVVSQQDFDKWYQEKVKPAPAQSPGPTQSEQKTPK